MATKKLNCNTDLVVNLMTFSPRGALGQAFVVEAIRRYADQCSSPEGQAALRAAMDYPPEDADGAIQFGPPADAWIEIAKDVKARCDAFYDPPRRNSDGSSLGVDEGEVATNGRF